ncbi:MAG: hypothetical protein EOP09_07250 [Proteobacteria bacterium]|nr:MAG: hypothetical protein EOP09_07250 [Pseudomonadota bacterium]
MQCQKRYVRLLGVGLVIVGLWAVGCASTRQLPQVHTGAQRFEAPSFQDAGEKGTGPVINIDFNYDGELTELSSKVILSKKESRYGYFDLYTLSEGTSRKKTLRLCTIGRNTLIGLGPKYGPAVSFILLGMSGEAFLDKRKKIIGKGVWRSGTQYCHTYAIPRIEKPIKLMIYSDSQYHKGSGHLIVSGFDQAINGTDVGRYSFSFD